MLGETDIYNLLPVCPSTALITAVPHGQSQYRPESPFKDLHRKSLLRVVLTAVSVGEECLATLNFIWISALLCVNASLVLAPGKVNVGDDGFSREGGARGLQRRSQVTSGGKDVPWEHKCGACGCFFPVYLVLHLYVHFREKAKVCMAVENWGKK